MPVMDTPSINTLKIESKSYTRFRVREWGKVHPELFGEKINWKYWSVQPLILKTSIGRRMVGTLKGNLMAGVFYIDELIIRDKERGKGYGKILITEAEKWAKKHDGHEVFLTTGEKWQARKFYKKMGYEVGARLPRHYSKTDFVLLRKYI